MSQQGPTNACIRALTSLQNTVGTFERNALACEIFQELSNIIPAQDVPSLSSEQEVHALAHLIACFLVNWDMLTGTCRTLGDIHERNIKTALEATLAACNNRIDVYRLSTQSQSGRNETSLFNSWASTHSISPTRSHYSWTGASVVAVALVSMSIVGIIVGGIGIFTNIRSSKR
jgi:hypothetical protein